MKNINVAATLVLLFYPLALIALGIDYASKYSIGKLELCYAFFGYYLIHISVGIGLHRLWSHNSYKTNKFIEFLLAILSAAALQGPAIAWASDHFRHHAYTDLELDPHSPKKFEGKFKGFLWAHIGWMLYKEFDNKALDPVAIKKLGKNKILLWQFKNYWKIAFFMHTAVPALVGYLISKTLAGAYCAFLFLGLGRALQQQITFCVNSICHIFGSRPYSKGSATDVWWLAPFLLGENWHNFHHAFPGDYRNGFRWYQLDMHKWIIYLMYKLGLARDLQVTCINRIQAKASDLLSQQTKDEWNALEQLCQKLQAKITNTICSINEQNLTSLKDDFAGKIAELRAKIEQALSQTQNFIDTKQLPPLKILRSAKNNLLKLEKTFDIMIASYSKRTV